MTDSQVEIATGTRFAFGANWKSFVDTCRRDKN